MLVKEGGVIADKEQRSRRASKSIFIIKEGACIY